MSAAQQISTPDGVQDAGQVGHEQGYLCGANRPCCSNCFAGPRFVANTPAYICGYGGFAVERAGWCPIWMPVTQWIDRNPSAAKKLGLGLGHGPVTANDTPDADEVAA